MELIGWLGVAFGLLVGPPQLYRIIKTGQSKDVSIWTYRFLVPALICYLIYAVSINDPVFITAQSINISVNGAILTLMEIHRWRLR